MPQQLSPYTCWLNRVQAAAGVVVIGVVWFKSTGSYTAATARAVLAAVIVIASAAIILEGLQDHWLWKQGKRGHGPLQDWLKAIWALTTILVAFGVMMALRLSSPVAVYSIILPAIAIGLFPVFRRRRRSG